MKITKQQKEAISSLMCERLSTNEDNLRCVEDFSNSNDNLVRTLQSEAFEEDGKGNIAYYVIKHPNGNILFYFSLKCGSLYESIRGMDSLQKARELYNSVIELKDDPELNENDKVLFDSIIERIRTGKGLIKQELSQISYSKKNQIIKELEHQSEDDLKRVGKTFAGVEIVHFCANENHRDDWDSLKTDQKMGVVIFWSFIVPKIQEVMKHIGCEYIYLFAADTTPDENLVNYYKTYLGFENTNDYGTTISLYDYGCKFMYQKTEFLTEKQMKFFENFNRDEDAV